ncbi:hypothetical protein AMAG_19846 [Allomyces macrogynus ATCC 38327]|uniref:Uncharacterized protein n=1 Tax=Allomyces macrogynus (strain ATCC 38327) TaxID=578462 RepID=A0A0L0T041_ALLM3|nr:hypothetical protein AMAG_19846 [Allomyces macrogynus ATCC 38327]|eukprot:KNE68117.1 hypothetical protein AMAG_19846 [Allomyces macrogynus ATCC 38327]
MAGRPRACGSVGTWTWRRGAAREATEGSSWCWTPRCGAARLAGGGRCFYDGGLVGREHGPCCWLLRQRSGCGSGERGYCRDLSAVITSWSSSSIRPSVSACRAPNDVGWWLVAVAAVRETVMVGCGEIVPCGHEQHCLPRSRGGRRD